MRPPSGPGALTPPPGPSGGPGAAVVTGVGRRMSWEIARALAARGYHVHLTDADGAVASRAATELGPPAFGSTLDVRSLPACRAAASRTRRRLGSLEVWVNADSVAASGAAWELDDRTRQRILEVELLGTINGTLAALEVMRAAGRGHVLNVAEQSPLLSMTGQAVHSAARHAAVAFSLATWADLRAAGCAEVSVSALAPSRRMAEGRTGRDSEPLARALHELLENPRPLLVVPRWREAIVRARWLWPDATPLGSRVRAARSRMRAALNAGPLGSRVRAALNDARSSAGGRIRRGGR